jgi:murein DD-endopeptidase MepM/ murein hydrolase activator NlpD
MDDSNLIKLLQGSFTLPVRGMEKFCVGKFSRLLEEFGTTEFEKLVEDSRYQEIIAKGMILGYNEHRVYNGQSYGYHWGIDVMSPEGTQVYAIDSARVIRVQSIDDKTANYKGETYGNNLMVVNEYENESGRLSLFMLYGHLGNLGNKYVKGQMIEKGEKIGVIGKGFSVENGGWPPHLHVQVALSTQGLNPYGGPELEALTIDLEKVWKLR